MMTNCQYHLRKSKIEVIDHGYNLYSLRYDAEAIYQRLEIEENKRFTRRAVVRYLPTMYINSSNILILSATDKMLDNQFKVNPHNVDKFLSIIDNLNSVFCSVDINEVIK